MRVTLTFDYQNKGVKAAKNDLKSLGIAAAKSAIGITSAAAAVTKLNRILKESVSLALADQKATANLAKALSNAGFGMAAQEVNKYIQSLQLATGVTEDQLRPAFLQLFTALGSVAEAQRVLTVAMDVSASTGKDLTTVTAAMSKAALGNRTSLGKLGVGLDKATLKSKTFDEILSILTNKFGGSAATAAETMAGKFDRIKIAVGEAKEEVGTGLLNALSMLATNGGKNVDDITTKIIDLGTAVGDIARGMGVIVSKFQTLANIKVGSGTIWSTFIESMPLIGPTLKLLGLIKDIGAEQRYNENIGKGGGYYQSLAQRQAEAAAKAAAAAEAKRLAALEAARRRAAALAAAKAAAEKRAAAAQKAKEDALQKKTNELAKQFDIERISLAAALSRETDEGTKSRLDGLMLLNDLQYTENRSLEEMQALIERIDAVMKRLTETAAGMVEEQAKWAWQVKMTAEEMARLVSLYQGAESGSAAQFRIADQLLMAGVNTLPGLPTPGGTPTGGGTAGSPTIVNLNVQGSLIAQQDLQAALAGAVNDAARAGISYSQLFNRL